MILDTIAASTRRRVEAAKASVSLDVMKKLALSLPKGQFSFEKALSTNGMSFICEVKKASPSKGLICPDFPYLEIALDYEAAGASAISVLTEPEYFLGRDIYLSDIRALSSLPLLRKDFTIDEYQIYEAKTIGADAVLLICALLDTKTIRRYISICDELGLSALVEAHTAQEVESALDVGARIVGVNNRDLKTFEVHLETCEKLRPLVPKNVLFVAESGIKTGEDIKQLSEAQVDAVLIGETLMRSPNRKDALTTLRKGGDQ
jgi:indole-3-glycerol phosphate synthase